MKVPEEVKKVEMESQNQRDQRVEGLWKKLDPHGTGELDVKGLQKGLRRIDHPLKNADDMMQEIIKMVDVNRDGKIQFEEFRTFVEAAERQLLVLFKSIDRNHDGQVAREELEAAFRKASLTVPKRRVAGFFNEIDLNNDGFISFEEWRDFLLFIPNTNGSPLAAAISYYNSIVTVNAEGDSSISEGAVEGLGTKGLLLHSLFGSILRLAQPPPTPTLSTPLNLPGLKPETTISSQQQQSRNGLNDETMAPARASYPQAVPGDIAHAAATAVTTGAFRTSAIAETERLSDVEECQDVSESRLMSLLPEPGYFAAGAISGALSRTATAPIDRLKVYFAVDNKPTAKTVVSAAKAVSSQAAVQQVKWPILQACRDLYKAGGFKTFYAGNGLNVIKITPENAIKFGTFEFMKRNLTFLEGHDDPHNLSQFSILLAGGAAGMAAQSAVYPLDTLKFRLQCETVKGGLTGNALLLQTARNMAKEGVFRSSYRGVTMGLIGMFPYSGIEFVLFEQFKTNYIRWNARYRGIHEEDDQLEWLANGVIGATSGGLGASAVYPLNLLRTRLQTQGTKMHPPTYTGWRDVLLKTYKNEGVRGLYKGLGMNLVKVGPSLAITRMSYEELKKILGLH